MNNGGISDWGSYSRHTKSAASASTPKSARAAEIAGGKRKHSQVAPHLNRVLIDLEKKLDLIINKWSKHG